MLKKCYKKLKKYLILKFPFIFSVLNKEKLIVKFLIALSLGGLADLIVLAILFDVFGLDIVISASMAFAVAFFIGFYLQKLWVFDCDDVKKENRQMLLFLALGLVKITLNAYLMLLLVDYLNIYYIFSQIIIGSALAIFTYLFEKFVIFKKENKL